MCISVYSCFSHDPYTNLILSLLLINKKYRCSFTNKKEKRVHEHSCDNGVTTKIPIMEVQADAQLLQWLASKSRIKTVYYFPLTDSTSLLQKVLSDMGHQDSQRAMCISCFYQNGLIAMAMVSAKEES